MVLDGRRALAVAGALIMFLAAGPAGPAAEALAASGTWADVKVPLPANADHTFAQLY
jgi:hypothetical protein